MKNEKEKKSWPDSKVKRRQEANEVFFCFVSCCLLTEKSV